MATGRAGAGKRLSSTSAVVRLFDRHAHLPFPLSVWIAPRKHAARFLLFFRISLVVLDCILHQLAHLARHGTSEPARLNESPLCPSLYHTWLKPMTWAKPLLKGTSGLFRRRIFRDSVHKFEPLLDARPDQKDFAVPPVTNSTKALFADGEPKAMEEALAKCKREHATMKGVVIVLMLLLAFYHVKGQGQDVKRPFRMKVDVDCNMRPHVQALGRANPVGFFTASTELEWMHLDGIDMGTTCFWTLARRTSCTLEANVKDTMKMAGRTVTADRKLHANTCYVRVAHSITSDVGVADVMHYPFQKQHGLTSESCTHKVLSIESVHVYKALPHLAPSVTIFSRRSTRLAIPWHTRWTRPLETNYLVHLCSCARAWAGLEARKSF
ncbi:hypothetical protein PsorP6_017965 [Peronosclerospora sorghi]|uniref:Uncharacterized protein n=1 Tax=Peronosclerospora sorghi TaxID=230839 RepID=A0ACC0WDG9_9STRA|nr:hypothetical protein PsorP6_017965 [Peronosclerospora sorghi]